MRLNDQVRVRRWAVLVAGMVPLLLAACSASVASDDGPVPEVTLDGVGVIPDALTVDPADAAVIGTIAPRLELLAQPDLGPVAESVAGNRLLMIGDSITVSTTERYGGEMCTALSLVGWRVDIAAEVGQHIDYAEEVLDERFAPDEGRDLDVVVINLGTNFRGDLADYQERLERIVDDLGNRQVVLVTVTEFNEDRVAVNSLIVDALIGRPNVRVVDWAGVTRANPDVLRSDRIHLSDDGRSRLVQLLADELGQIDADGECVSGPVRSEAPPTEELVLPAAPEQGADPDPSDPEAPEDP